MRKIEKEILNNPLFFKWIFHPDEQTDEQWKEYIGKHSEYAPELEQVKIQLLKIHQEKDVFDEQEKKDLARRIMQHTINRANVRRKRPVRVLFKYAAVSLLFFCLGGSIVYLLLDQDLTHEYLVDAGSSISIKGPTLILDNHERVALDKEESSISYLDKNKIVINGENLIKKDSLKKEAIQINQLVIPYGNRSKIILCDSTVIWLNAGSRLIYPSTFTGDQREVFLFGEAFLEVSKDKKHPFVVSTNDVSIQVLGTKFNVSAYPEDEVVQTVLAEGRILIKRTDSPLLGKEVVINPGQMATFNKKSSETKVVNVDPDYYVIWKEGLLKFNNEDLSRVIKKLERFYNVSFIFRNPLDGSIQISGKLDLKEDINEVIKYVEKAADIKITVLKGSGHYAIN